MTETKLDELKRYAGFEPADAERVMQAADQLAPVLPEIVEQFYARLESDASARAVLDGSGSTRGQLQATMLQWMKELFDGPYDRAYYRRRARIGRAHVEVNLPAHFLVPAISVVRTALTQHVRKLNLPDADALILSVGKLLDLDLAIMLEAYHIEAEERIRAAERELYQERLEESEHLANVGHLAATLAHEIKNPLAGISGAIQVIGHSLAPDNPHKEVIGEILSEIDRLDATARDLLIYAKPKPPLRKQLHIGPLLQDTLMRFRQDPVVHGLPIHCDGLESAATAHIDETQFRQVITNLLLNAAHACEKGGAVTFRLATADDMVRIEVIDTGVGVAPDAVGHVFEPFYSTKAKGTGLGLSICKWIVESHGGRITLESEEGKGTKVTVELPGSS
ncbi:MAG TPA: ATP-binding protein [Phycisphaerae bacterium]|nr:ATP-binding protein [Phycisphaerae bacterium]